jgi:hypothetical protein
MKKHLLLTLVAILFATTNIFANSPDFSVVACKGEVLVKRDKATEWTKLASGQKLFSKDQVKIEKNSYLGLVHSSGSPLEVKSPGSFAVAKLTTQVSAKKSSVTKKFTEYIVGELSKTDKQDKSNYRKDMETLGAVERGKSKANAIEAKFPRTTVAIDNKLDFSWYKKEGVTSYKFVIKDLDGKKVVEKDVNGTNITIDLAALKLKKGQCYNWSVASGNAKSEEYCVQLIPDSEANIINSELKEIKAEIGNNPGAVGQLILASYYEDKNIVNRAVSAYEAAIKLSQTENYKMMYASYLNRLGLKAEAASVLK